jgi:predicted Zn-dependent protease
MQIQNKNSDQNLKSKLLSSHEAIIESEFKKKKSESDFVAFKYISETTRDLSVRNGKPDEIQHYEDEGLLIEVMRDGHIGYAATSELTAEGIDRAFQRALEITTRSASRSVAQFDLSVRPNSVGSYISPRQKSVDQLSLAEIYDFLKITSLRLKKDDQIVTALSDAMVIDCKQVYMSSNGADFQQDFNIIVNSFSATAQSGGETQTRTLHGGRGNCRQIGSELFNLDEALPVCESIAIEAIELLTAENCPTDTCDLILAPDQMLLQIHESIGHPLEIDRILGDERNFAGWSFVQPEDFGKLKYGSSIMNVVFDPGLEGQLASYQFDEIGNRAEKKHLIKNGILQAGLGSLESQFRSKLSGVANSRSSSWNRAPIDRMANVNLEHGDLSLNEMVSKVQNGIMMFANRSWSIDDYRKKFQFGCEFAKKIENGKITKTLKNPNYRGVTVPFWNNLIGLTKADTVEMYGSPYCGKGEPSQIIRVGHSSPYALFKNIEIFGG